jgi:hypothetical protein
VESQKKRDDMTEAETEEQEIRKRRTDGTPCNKENFETWRESFTKEMEEQRVLEETTALIEAGKKKKVEKKEDKAGRISGFLHFSGSNGMLHLEALERAAEEAEAQDLTEAELAELAVNAELFDDDDDLDDLDFNSDDDDDDDDEPDI